MPRVCYLRNYIGKLCGSVQRCSGAFDKRHVASVIDIVIEGFDLPMRQRKHPPQHQPGNQ